MNVFRYDESFEGLLTAVFDAYTRRTFPDALLGPGTQAPLFTQSQHTVASDPQRSDRVWKGLRARLPREVCNMLHFAWLTREQGVDMALLRYMRRVFDTPRAADTPSVATDFSDPDILHIKQLAHRVAKEREHLIQFTRFQKAAPSPDVPTDPGTKSYGRGATFFAPVEPLYDVLPLAISWFRDRFRDQRWLIYDTRRRYGYYYDLETVTEVTMEDDTHLLSGRLDSQLAAGDEQLFQQLWKSYFDAMAIDERINPRLQRSHMPRRFWHLLPEMQ